MFEFNSWRQPETQRTMRAGSNEVCEGHLCGEGQAQALREPQAATDQKPMLEVALAKQEGSAQVAEGDFATRCRCWTLRQIRAVYLKHRGQRLPAADKAAVVGGR